MSKSTNNAYSASLRGAAKLRRGNPLLLIILAILLLVSAPCQAAIDFDGSNDYVRSSSAYVFNTSTPWTWSAWFNRSSTAGDRSVLGDGNGFARAVFVNASSLYVGNDADIFQLITFNTSIGSWFNIMLISRGNGVHVDVYRNGVLSGTFTAGGSFTFRDIGRGYTSYYWAGSIDDVRIYNRALSLSEIEVLYNAKRKRVGGSVANGMVAHYEMDGGEIGSAVSTVIDASGNSNHGTGNGGASLKFIEGVVQR